jgi:thiol-disulfide isomerase/thioredoxin
MNKNILLLIACIVIIASIVLLQRLHPQRTESEAMTVQPVMQTSGNVERLAYKTEQYSRAVELVAPDAYINSEPFTLQDHIGKQVILVDFWTYSCINCQRTTPYLTAWDETYRDDGLLIVGVHTPEFTFEKNETNVQQAVERLGIEYPVVLDNQFQTWQAYDNHYWPHKYLIDIDGFVVYDHIGEGGYDETEAKIRELLAERRTVLGLNDTIAAEAVVSTDTPQYQRIRTPELYFGYGYDRGQLGNNEGLQPEKSVLYTLPTERKTNTLYLQGKWLNKPDYMELQGKGEIVLTYTARNVYMVAGADKPTTVTVLLDGVPINTVEVHEQTLYTVFSADTYGQHELTLQSDAGLQAYTFTFG